MPINLAHERVLITGVTGYIGSRLAERLVGERRAVVRGLARDPAKGGRLAEIGVDVVAGDVTESAGLRAALAGCTVVVHCAAWVGEQGSRPAVWAANVDGTRRVVAAALAVGVRRFVQVSSCAVYGSPQNRFDIDESSPMVCGSSLYADSKIAAEEVVWAAHRDQGLPVVAARPSQVYGLGSPQFTLRPLAAIQAGKMVLIDGGRHLCKPIYIDNLVDGLLACAEADVAVGEAINLTDGAPVPWRDFFGAYARMAGVERLPSVPYPVAWLGGLANEIAARLRGKSPGVSRATVRALHSRNSFSNRKAQRLLGWTPAVDLAEGMARTEAWLQENGYLGRV
jgi:nucleoside-diphosphate-sugar epimerase